MPTYTIPEIERENVQKLVSRFQKKAASYGQEASFQFGSPYAKERAIYALVDSPFGDYPVQKQIDTELVEVFDLTVEADVIRKEGYSVVAKIEHMENANIVTTFGCEIKLEWTKLRPFCQHCGCYRHQRITFIVRHENGEEKQVGRTCLKDYCGIDPKYILSLKELHDVLLGEDVEKYDFGTHHVPRAYETVEALAIAIRVLKSQGYVKSEERGSNKETIAKIIDSNDCPVTDDEKKEAEAMAENIMKADESKLACERLSNIKALLESGYCKASHFGYIAYAPVAYERYQKSIAIQEEREAAKQNERTASDYVCQVGQRVTLDISEMTLLTSWETMFGYTYLYKIIDTAGNVLIWYASHVIDACKRIKATIKDHTVRDGVKQTIVTRCTAIAA